MVSEPKEPIEKLLEQSLVFKLKLIRQILEFLPAEFSKKEEEILAYLNRSRTTTIVLKLKGKFKENSPKVGFRHCLQKSAVTQI